MNLFNGNQTDNSSTSSNSLAKTSESSSTSKKADTSSNSSETETLESYINSSGSQFDDFEHNEEHDAYILSRDLNTVMGNENAIEFFNDDIYNTLHKEITTDKPVIFRAWDGTITAALVYFSVDNFNREQIVTSTQMGGKQYQNSVNI